MLKLEPKKEIILKEFDSGKSCTSIAKSLGEYSQAVYNLVKKYRPNHSFLPLKGNTHYFENIDSYSKAYILGFIAADGSLVRNHSGSMTLTITVKYEDKEVLEFIRKEIGNTHKLLEIVRPASYEKTKIIHHIRYYITDNNISDSIVKYGITPNKSLTMGNILDNIPYKYRDAFIIGYFDGDGSVHIQNKLKQKGKYEIKDYSLYIQIRGTTEFLSGICNHLAIDVSHIHQFDSIPTLSFANKKDVIRLFKCYNNLSFYYKRKYDVFLERINHKSFEKYK